MPLSSASSPFAAWASLLDDGGTRRGSSGDAFEGLLDFAFRLAELVEGQMLTLRQARPAKRRRRRAVSGALRRLARAPHLRVL